MSLAVGLILIALGWWEWRDSARREQFLRDPAISEATKISSRVTGWTWPLFPIVGAFLVIVGMVDLLS